MSEHLDGTADGTFRHYEAALAQIAAGRLDNGRALGGPTAQEIARNCLFAAGVSWTDGIACSQSSNPHRDAKANSPEQDRESDCKANPELTGHSEKERSERVLLSTPSPADSNTPENSTPRKT